MELRPLGFGEIFDRAVTLYIRNFAVFVAIVMVLVLPTAILHYIFDVASNPQWAATILRALQHPQAAGKLESAVLYGSPGAVVPLIALLFVTYALWPFALNAVAVGVARIYRAQPAQFRACYEAVLRRWPQIVGLLAAELLIIVVWYLVTVMLALVVVLTAALVLRAAAGPAAVFMGLIVASVVTLAMFALLFVVLVALTFAMYSCVIEDRGVVESLALGFARVFNRREFWRAALFSIATAVLVVVASLLFNVVALFMTFAHLPVLQAIVESLPQALITPFTTVLFAIYYFDVRIRREGFDLEAGLDRLIATAPA